MLDLESLDFSKSNGLVTIVTQDAVTGMVLMVAHADRTALQTTLETGEMHYTSRTRGLWRKGETSGNVQRVVSLKADCDGDSILARVIQSGPACHTGTMSCFGEPASDTVSELDAVIRTRVEGADVSSPSYTRKLLGDRNLRIKKIGEEAAELVMALADDDRERATEEASDLLYHILVALQASGIRYDAVRRALYQRSIKKNTSTKA